MRESSGGGECEKKSVAAFSWRCAILSKDIKKAFAANLRGTSEKTVKS